MTKHTRKTKPALSRVSKYDTFVHVRVDSAKAAKAREILARHKLTLSDYIRQGIDDLLAREGESNRR